MQSMTSVYFSFIKNKKEINVFFLLINAIHYICC